MSDLYALRVLGDAMLKAYFAPFLAVVKTDDSQTNMLIDGFEVVRRDLYIKGFQSEDDAILFKLSSKRDTTIIANPFKMVAEVNRLKKRNTVKAKYVSAIARKIEKLEREFENDLDCK